MNVILVTGGFDPLHSGHLAYFEAAKKLGDVLVVGVNSDEWLIRKKNRAFMPRLERTAIIDALSVVDKTIWFDDTDGSAKSAIKNTQALYPNSKIIFANGGDRTKDNIPEMGLVEPNLEFKFGVGGEDKKNSSSWILDEWKAPKTQRPWGYYRVLHESLGIKVKELTVDPGKSMSMQRHKSRSEFWMVDNGVAIINSTTDSGYSLPPKILNKHEGYSIPVFEWHQVTNPLETPLRIIEIQYGEQCIEEDIERL
jgi:cytidyltransferase-like protein